MFILPGLLAALPCVSSPSEQSTVSASAFAELESRAEAGDGVAQYNLAVEYLRSNPAAPDYHSAVKWLSASATQGNVDETEPAESALVKSKPDHAGIRALL